MPALYNRDRILEDLKENVLEVTFDKVSDGSSRTMRLTLAPKLLPNADLDHVAEQHARPENRSVVVGWEVDLQAWRSFKIDNLKYVQVIDGYL